MTRLVEMDDRGAPLAARLPAPVSEAYEQRAAWQVGIVMFAMGALAFLAFLGAPDPNTSDHGAILVFAAIDALSALVIFAVGPKPALARVAPIWGTLTLSAFIAFARPLGAAPFFYIWPILISAYFSRRDVVVNLLALAVSFGLALALFQPAGIRTALWMGAVLSLSLLAAVMRILKERVDRLVNELHESSLTDPLTGLLNRRAFAAIFDSELKRAERSGRTLTLAVFDLDHFKQINDHHGHAAGDRALCSFAQLLRSEQREGDPVVRIGGEEFAVLLVETDAEGARRFAVRIATSPKLVVDEDVRLSVSAGLATSGNGLQTLDNLLLAADSALYVAKAAGRSRVALHGGGIMFTPDSAPSSQSESSTIWLSVPRATDG